MRALACLTALSGIQAELAAGILDRAVALLEVPLLRRGAGQSLAVLQSRSASRHYPPAPTPQSKGYEHDNGAPSGRGLGHDDKLGVDHRSDVDRLVAGRGRLGEARCGESEHEEGRGQHREGFVNLNSLATDLGRCKSQDLASASPELKGWALRDLYILATKGGDHASQKILGSRSRAVCKLNCRRHSHGNPNRRVGWALCLEAAAGLAQLRISRKHGTRSQFGDRLRN